MPTMAIEVKFLVMFRTRMLRTYFLFRFRIQKVASGPGAHAGLPSLALLVRLLDGRYSRHPPGKS